MHIKKTNKLKQDFPTFFHSRNIEVGNGWYNIVYDLCSKINNKLSDDEKEKFIVTQVKEKFGGLRFYTNLVNDEVEKLIIEAEEKSFKTCEKCGKVGKKRLDLGWVKCYCTYHYLLEKSLRRMFGRYYRSKFYSWSYKMKRMFK